MGDGFIKVEVLNADALNKALKKMPKEVSKYLAQAGQESAKLILETEGLKKYPPSTEANTAGRTRQVTFKSGKTVTFRMGYYVRGEGSYIPVRGGGYKFLANSQRYGTKWTTKKITGGVEIGNSASYAKYLAGENQPEFMARIGWRKLLEVGNEKLPEIVKIYNAWIAKMLKDLGFS